MVITESGQLVWIVDGYTTSDVHPYSRAVEVPNMGSVNYIRNAVKATINAYNGETRLYVFAPDDPIIAAYQRLFPDLFRPAAEMPADLRAHTRYPETLFRIQAEIYRTYHMLDPQAFYNKEDVWDLALHAAGQNSGTESVTPSYIMAALPGETKPEFLLTVPYTPHNKNNLIGLLAGRCDGENLGKMTVWMLSKQELIPGPMNVSAYINQDQNISKDLTLWNQEGSHVLRGQILVLPVGNTFLYVDPIYIQAANGSMPQLKKIVMAVGNRLIYANNYNEALKQLASGDVEPGQGPEPSGTSAPAGTAGPQTGGNVDPRLQRIRDHMRRYRELASQGRWADAGRELEAIEGEIKQ
jgi:uncharacterized membrane protein (UPF0182 family)